MATLLSRSVALLTLEIADMSKRMALHNWGMFLRASRVPPRLLERLSPYAALRAARHAQRDVPAYRELLAQSGWRDKPSLDPADRLRLLPVTDKESYIKAFRTELRCLEGKIPTIGTQIDESSGSSGVPYNWVRGARELHEVHLELSQFARYLCGHNVITINGFSMGSWATGVNVGEFMRRIGIVKSTGPDVDKILYTLQFFGPDYPYIITGYPPFLKHLIDEGEARGFDWGSFRIHGFLGGEGMSEALRAYLERRFVAVFSGYGASDLDIGVAGELPLSVWIRKHATKNPKLRAALFGEEARMPMLFQYNPLDYYIETNEASELIVTINRLAVLSPRIRYNIHDTGGLIGFNKMQAVLRDFGLAPKHEVPKREQPVFRLPFLYLFGRSDSTVSYMGANLYPEDFEQALFSDAEDARRLGAFCLELVDIGKGEQRPCVHVEVVEGPTDDEALAERLRRRVLAGLLANNRDFRASLSEDRSAGEFLLRLHVAGQGPFVLNQGRIKRKYIVAGQAPATQPGGVA